MAEQRKEEEIKRKAEEVSLGCMDTASKKSNLHSCLIWGYYVNKTKFILKNSLYWIGFSLKS